MNEAETRAELIDPLLKLAGWGEVEGSRVLREFHITDGRILKGGKRGKAEIADYVLVFNNQKIGVIEAKESELPSTEGVAQAKQYADKLKIDYTYSTNGKEIYEISMKTSKEQFVKSFPTPQELWDGTYAEKNEWREKFQSIPFAFLHGSQAVRYYQEIAVNKALEALAEDKKRILLTLATGTGKTSIAVQIAWKLFQARWNLSKDGKRRPRVLFLADRNILATQAFNSFTPFEQDALVRIRPEEIRKKGSVPTNASIFFTIFQTFMSGPNDTPYYGEYPADFFDLIIIDECHRGGANNEGNWRGILDFFSPAVQIGLTATPKRKDNVDTYRYFGEPIYSYSLKEGISDGFLTPFKVKKIQTTMDKYIYTSDDEVVEGQVEEGKVYQEKDFNVTIEIREREAKRVAVLLSEINQDEKTLVFCANQSHALLIRDLINQQKKSSNPLYCVRVTAKDGLLGEQFLREFQDNEKTIPTILTTSQKLSTGVDARNVRNIVLLRPVNSMIEFKQIVGRGTRLFEGKEYFTIYDFVEAYLHFSDPEWDGEPLDEGKEDIGEPKDPGTIIDYGPVAEPPEHKEKIRIKLRDGKDREIQHMMSTSYWSANGKPLSSEEFLQNVQNVLPNIFTSEKDLFEKWSDPISRKKVISQLFDLGITTEQMDNLSNVTDSGQSDFFDVLSSVLYATAPISRTERAEKALNKIKNLNQEEQEFLAFILEKYVESGFSELDEEKLPKLLELKYQSIDDSMKKLGGVEKARQLFFMIQKKLFES